MANAYHDGVVDELEASVRVHDACLVGPRGCGKSRVVRRLADRLRQSVETVQLYEVPSSIPFLDTLRQKKNDRFHFWTGHDGQGPAAAALDAFQRRHGVAAVGAARRRPPRPPGRPRRPPPAQRRHPLHHSEVGSSAFDSTANGRLGYP